MSNQLRKLKIKWSSSRGRYTYKYVTTSFDVYDLKAE
jgi:hypothetical protein